MDSFGVAQRVNIGPGTCHLSPLLAASLTLVPKNKKKSLEVGVRSMRLKSGKTRDGGVMRFILFSMSTIDEGDCIDGRSKLKCDEMVEGFWR